MDDELELVMVSVRIPRYVATQAKRLAEAQDRTVQAVYGRALRLGLELEEERDKIATAAIEAAERRQPQRHDQPEED